MLIYFPVSVHIVSLLTFSSSTPAMYHLTSNRIASDSIQCVAFFPSCHFLRSINFWSYLNILIQFLSLDAIVIEQPQPLLLLLMKILSFFLSPHSIRKWVFCLAIQILLELGAGHYQHKFDVCAFFCINIRRFNFILFQFCFDRIVINMNCFALKLCARTHHLSTVCFFQPQTNILIV